MAKKHKKDPKSWKDFKRQRQGDTHIEHCGSGYYKPSCRVRLGRFRQIHHIVCVSTVQDGYISETLTDPNDLSFIKKCLKITKWDINAAENNIGLPLKKAFFVKPNDSWDNLPCHQIDHDIYTEAVKNSLYYNIWSKLLQDQEECNIEPVSIQAKLNRMSDKWRQFLEKRGSGKDSGGNNAKTCWEHRNGKLKNIWYIPFSMDPGKPTERNAPPDLPTRGNLADKLKEWFQKIK
jgi:hypothetical protein